MSAKYAEIWKTVIECAKQYGVKAFTGWGISDSLSWFKNIGATMVTSFGEIKEFAKELFVRNKEKNKNENSPEISIKNATKNALKNTPTTEECQAARNAEVQEKNKEEIKGE